MTSKADRMDLGNMLLIAFLIGRSQCCNPNGVPNPKNIIPNPKKITQQCSENFTTVGNSKMLIVEKRLPFIEAEENCRDMGSELVEFWNEDEWNEVQTLQGVPSRLGPGLG